MQTILVVDDDKDLLFSVQMVLQRRHYAVVPLSDCTAAVSRALELSPDLILLDVDLGACDGRELCKALKRDYRMPIPVLLFSANGQYVSDAQTYGADGFIHKPFNSAEFVDYIQKYLSAVA